MAEVYLVVSGEYSEPHAAYTKKEKAQEIVDRLNGTGEYGEYAVEAIPLDVDRGVRTVYCVWIDRATGEEIKDRREARVHNQPWECEAGEERDWGREEILGACSTRGFDVALKAARDRRARLQAEEAGVG